MISTHILDTSRGLPATDVKVRLEKREGTKWIEVKAGLTNSDGRFAFDCELTPATYQISFEIEKYFEKEKRAFFFMNNSVVFKVEDIARKYHVPLLLSPFGFSTYRGS